MKPRIGEVIEKINVSGIEVMREFGYFAYYLEETFGNSGTGNSWNSQGQWMPYANSFMDNKIHLVAKIYKEKHEIKSEITSRDPEDKLPCQCGRDPVEFLLWVDPERKNAPNGIYWPAMICPDCMVMAGEMGLGPVRTEKGHPIRGSFKTIDEAVFQDNFGQTKDKYPFIRGLPKPEMKND